MFAMLMEKKKQERGFYLYDYTVKRTQEHPDAQRPQRLQSQEKWRTLRSNVRASARAFKELVKERSRRGGGEKVGSAFWTSSEGHLT
uniref:HMG box domain-containing protein n=2 Tax=Macrostomum lignano TaxID=282301 RepID=A0A1I8HAY1_9PLAT